MRGTEPVDGLLVVAIDGLPLRSAPGYVDLLLLALLAMLAPLTRWRLPLVAVGAVCDVFDALLSPRPRAGRTWTPRWSTCSCRLRRSFTASGSVRRT